MVVHKFLLILSNLLAVAELALIPPFAGLIAKLPYLAVPMYLVGWTANYAVLCILTVAMFGLISLTINKKKEYKKHNRFYDVLFGWLMGYAAWICGADVTVTGMNKVPKPSEGRFLFVSNHRSIYDTFIQVGAFWKYPLSFISKPENFKIVMGNRYMTRCRYMAIDRSDVRDGARITSNAAKMIQTGECCVGVYPEGTRNRTAETLLEFKPGCFKSAQWARCPIVIGVVHDSAQMRPRFPKRTKVWFEIVDVLPYESFKDLKTHEISDIVRQKMLDSLAGENPQAIDLREPKV